MHERITFVLIKESSSSSIIPGTHINLNIHEIKIDKI
jgi:hypothetical protein